MKKKIRKSIFLPDSILENEPTLFLKTLKIGNLMRVMFIFSVDELFFYNDSAKSLDIEILKKNIQYILIPPQLRKYLPKDRFLQFSGVLPPIPIKPLLNTNNRKVIGVIINTKKEVGRKNFFNLTIKLDNSKVIKRNYCTNKNHIPQKGDLILLDRNENIDRFIYLDDYKFQNKIGINFLDINIANWIEKYNNSKALNIICSKNGISLNISMLNEFGKKFKDFEELRLMYGPIKGSFIKYLRKRGFELSNYSLNSERVNFFPEQGTTTIKIEEAVLGSLSIINTIMPE